MPIGIQTSWYHRPKYIPYTYGQVEEYIKSQMNTKKTEKAANKSERLVKDAPR
jgi:hypothetical protein